MVLPDQLYRHYKNKRVYRVLFCAVHTETHEPLVIYQDVLEPIKLWARPMEMFLSEVQHEGCIVKRFVLQKP